MSLEDKNEVAQEVEGDCVQEVSGKSLLTTWPFIIKYGIAQSKTNEL